MSAVKYLVQVLAMALGLLVVLFAIDWVSRSIIADILAWVALLVGPVVALRWALK